MIIVRLEKAPVANSYSLISGATSASYTYATGSTVSGTCSFEVQVIDHAGATVTSARSRDVLIRFCLRLFAVLCGCMSGRYRV